MQCLVIPTAFVLWAVEDGNKNTILGEDCISIDTCESVKLLPRALPNEIALQHGLGLFAGSRAKVDSGAKSKL
jgi:hypothetical protein